MTCRESFAGLRKSCRFISAAAAVLLALFLAACNFGNASGTSTGETTTPSPAVNNVQPVTIDAGPLVNGQPVGDADVLFTSVTICLPGTITCQTVDHVQVDTGSTGIRILASALTLPLPISATTSGAPLANCIQYADTTYQWGPVATADIKMAGEVASSVPIQVAGQPNFPAAPSACSAGGMAVDTVFDLGANGILGVGNFRQDCGSACSSAAGNPGFYFGCGPLGCSVTSVSLAAQLQNPVWMFPQDNNGLAIVLPPIAPTGQATVAGSMIFGIGTQSNNALGGARAQATDGNGYFTTTFNGVPYSSSFIDTGSNGLFFLDAKTTGLPECPSAQAPGFYCPTSLANFSAFTTGPNPNGSSIQVSANIAFSIANALTLFNSPNTAFNNLGGENAGSFDWGIPFFFGRSVFVGIEGQSSGAGTGPYWAY